MKKSRKVKKAEPELISVESESKRVNPKNSPASPVKGMVRGVMVDWDAPLPPPEILNEFNRVVENGAERIVSAWERESSHRQKMEKRALGWDIFESLYGKTLAFVFVILVLIVCIYAISEGAWWIALVLGSGIVGMVVWAFVKTNTRNRNDS